MNLNTNNSENKSGSCCQSVNNPVLYNRNKTFRQALKNSLPIMFSYLVVGFTFGIMLSEAGYTWLHALIGGLFMYSGSLQIALVPMMVLHTPIPVIAISSFLINARYMFYGIGYKERFKKQGILYPYMVCAFPDEVYGVFSSVKYPPDVDPVKCDLWTALLCHSSWISGGVLGCLIGDKISVDLSGIDFAATAMFVCIVVDQWRSAKSHIPAIIGLISGLGCLVAFGADNFMLPALIVSLVLLLVLKPRIEAAEALREESMETDEVVDAAGGRNAAAQNVEAEIESAAENESAYENRDMMKTENQRDGRVQNQEGGQA